MIILGESFLRLNSAEFLYDKIINFLKYNKKFEKASWGEVYKIIKSKFENTTKEKICGFVGDLPNMETSYIFKEFFDRTLNNNFYESRADNRFINTSKRENYIFNWH